MPGSATPDSGGAEGPFGVAVASFRAPALLDACLGSIIDQVDGSRGRVVVARRGSVAEIEALEARWPSVRFVSTDPAAGVPELRGAALGAVEAGPVLLTEDHCVVSPGWVARLRAALAAGADVAGGGMGNARTARALDWGAYFAEYGFFGPGAAGGPRPPSPTGANVAYAEGCVSEVAAWCERGLWENVIHDRLRADGRTFAFDPDALVRQNATYRFGAFVRDRFVHGRAYARRRLVEEPGASRLTRIVATPLLPFLLFLRIGRSAGAAFPGAYARSAPFSIAFLSGWAVGELVGYLRGAESADG